MNQRLAICSSAAPHLCKHCRAEEPDHTNTCPLAPPCRHCWRQTVQTVDGRIMMIHQAICPGADWRCPSRGCDGRVVSESATCPGCDGRRPCTIVAGCVKPYRHGGFCARGIN